MNYRFSVFDIFTYLFPGSFMLLAFVYLGQRISSVTIDEILSLQAAILVPLGFIFSVVLGHMLYPLGRLVTRPVTERVRSDFIRRNPRHASLPLLEINYHFLLNGIEIKDKELGEQVHRLRATSLMLRHCCIPACLAASISLVEIFISPYRIIASIAFFIFAGAAVLTLLQGHKLSRWAIYKTYELATWLFLSGEDTVQRQWLLSSNQDINLDRQKEDAVEIAQHTPEETILDAT